MLAYLLLRAIIFVSVTKLASGTGKCISSDRREYFIDVIELKKFKTKCSFLYCFVYCCLLLLLLFIVKLFDLILADISDEKFVSNH